MTSSYPRPEYAHIAANIRAAMQEKGLRVMDVHEALGQGKKSTAIYPWLNGTAAPSKRYASQLMKILGLTKADITPKQNVTMLEPSRALTVAAPKTAAATGLSHSADVLIFNVSSNGMARIRLDIQLPLETASPLLRMLLDAGLVMKDTD